MKYVLLVLLGICANATAGTTIPIFGEIKHDQAESVAAQLVIANSADDKTSPILLVIDSPGGDIGAGNLIASAILISQRPVDTLCIGLCESMGAMLFEMGRTRYVWPRALLMFHEAHYQLSGTPEQIANEKNAFDKDIAFYETLITKRIGITREQFHASVVQELYLHADEAIAGGYADTILTTPQMPE